MSTFKQFLAEANFTFKFDDISDKGKAANRATIAKTFGFTAKLPEMREYFKKATAENFVASFNAFVSKFPTEANLIDKNKIDGIGPGELLSYFIFDNIGVGGKNSSIDLFLDGKEWAEAKAGAPVGTSTLTNFKITKDGAKAVTQIMKDLKDFNEKYSEITGEDLPGWREANELKADTLKDWADVNLKNLAKGSKDGSKKAIGLTLKKDGDLTQSGDSEPILNVRKDKSTAPLRDLITGGGKIVVDPRIETLEKIVRAWAEQAHSEYVSGKKFVLFASKSGKLTQARFVGNITPDMIGLYNTHRSQPWAEVYLEPKKSKDTKAETKE